MFKEHANTRFKDAIPMFKHHSISDRSPMDWNRQWKERTGCGGGCETAAVPVRGAGLSCAGLSCAPSPRSFPGR
jgi:hypothetical protein